MLLLYIFISIKSNDENDDDDVFDKDICMYFSLL